GVVDDDRAVGHRLLEDRAVEGNVLADPVEDQVVAPRAVEADPADHGGLRDDVAAGRVDPLDEGEGEGAFLTEENADAFHDGSFAQGLLVRPSAGKPEIISRLPSRPRRRIALAGKGLAPGPKSGPRP